MCQSIKFELLSVLACLLAVVLLIHHSLYVDLGFDPAYHATVAKNFALQGKYATSYDQVFFLNPDITTGPVLILWGSLFIFFLGNQLWVPAFSALILNFLALSILCFLVRDRRVVGKSFFTFTSCLLLTLFLYCLPWLTSFKGDFLAMVFIFICLLCLYPVSGSVSYKRSVIAVIFFVLAVATKKTAAVGIIGFIPFFSCLLLKHSFLVVAKYVACMLLPLLLILFSWLLFQEFMLSDMSELMQQERLNYQQEFFINQGSGIAQFFSTNDKWELIQDNFFRNTASISEFFIKRFAFTFYHWLGIVLLLVTLFFGVCRVKPREINRFYFSLVLFFVAYFLWFIFFSAAWNAKYAVNAIFLLFLTAALVLCEKRIGGGYIILFLMLFGSANNLYWPNVKRVLLLADSDSEYRQELLQVKKILMSDKLQKENLAGCGWVFAPHELEYILPEMLNFSDCRQLILSGLAFDEKYYLALYPDVIGELAKGDISSAQQHYFLIGRERGYRFRYEWISPVNFTLVINNVYWNYSAYKEGYKHIVNACAKQPVFSGDYLSIFSCQQENLQRGIYTDEREYFLKNYQKLYYVHKPAQLSLGR